VGKRKRAALQLCNEVLPFGISPHFGPSWPEVVKLHSSIGSMPRRYVLGCHKTERNGAALPLYKKRWPGRMAATTLIGISPPPMLMAGRPSVCGLAGRKYQYTNRGIIAGRVATPAPP